jgi:hypothetical protein
VLILNGLWTLLDSIRWQTGQPEMAVPLKAAGLRRLRPALQVLLVKKENAATWLPHAVALPGCARTNYSKIRFALKGKPSEKDNAETQSALRFAEKGGLAMAFAL